MNKEQIKIQIENLKAELEALERELNKPEKFEFIYNKNTTYSISSYQIMGEKNGIDEDYLSNFRYRQLEINAKEDFQLQK